MSDWRKWLIIIAWFWACCTAFISAAEVIRVGGAAGPSRVPPALRRGNFIPPQAISAVDISDDGKWIAVGTMAFRHDRNFFVLSADGGKVLWGRHIEPWAPYQVAALSSERSKAACSSISAA